MTPVTTSSAARLMGDAPGNAAPSSASPAFRSLFRPGDNCYRVARARRASLLVDGDAYFKAFARAALAAKRSVVIVGWDFHSRTLLHHGLEGVPETLGDFLNFLVKRRRGLNVYVLTWDYSILFARGREPSPAYGLGWRPHRHVHFCYDSGCPFGAAFHQKLVIVDGALGFCGGLDLTRGRWDIPDHRADDPRRINPGETDPYAPFHDAMLAADSEVAAALQSVANDRWMRATGKLLPDATVSSDPWPADLPVMFSDVDVAVARTLPPFEGQAAVTEVQALYLDMIAAARRHIYLENQYFTSKVLGDALAARLAEPEGPEIVAVLRLRSGGWLEAPTMSTLRSVLLRKLRDADRYGRFHAFYPHIPGLSPERCCDLHTKLMIVDDEWLRVGSANFSNRSMSLDTECDLVLEARGDSRTRGAIAAARDRLLAEHLDVTPSELQAGIQRTGSLGQGVKALLKLSGRTLRYFERLDEPSPAMVAVANGVADRERPVSLNELITGFVPEPADPPVLMGRVAIVVIALVLLGMASLWRYSPLADLADVNLMIERAQAFADKPWVALVLVAAYTPASLALFPRPLLTLFAVLAFGPWLGFVYAICGILVAALATYALGTRLDRTRVRRIAGKRLNQVAGVMRRRGIPAMTAARLLPIAPFPVVNVVAGAIGIRPLPFIVGTTLGILPGTLVATVFAHQIVTGLRDPGSINVWLIVAMLAAMLVVMWVMRRRVFG